MVTSQKRISAESNSKYETIMSSSFGQKEDDDKCGKGHEGFPHKMNVTPVVKDCRPVKYLRYHTVHASIY